MLQRNKILCALRIGATDMLALITLAVKAAILVGGAAIIATASLITRFAPANRAESGGRAPVGKTGPRAPEAAPVAQAVQPHWTVFLRGL